MSQTTRRLRPDRQLPVGRPRGARRLDRLALSASVRRHCLLRRPAGHRGERARDDIPWREQDEGIWEVRGEASHFTYSKFMCWVGSDYAIQAEKDVGLEVSLDPWRQVRETIHQEVCRNGFDRRACHLCSALWLRPPRRQLAADGHRAISSPGRSPKWRARSGRLENTCSPANSSFATTHRKK